MIHINKIKEIKYPDIFEDGDLDDLEFEFREIINSETRYLPNWMVVSESN